MSAQPSTEDAEAPAELHGGRLIARRLKAHGVSRLFTLSGGHLFSIYDGCRDEGIEIVDVRHEQTAAFAAEGWAKVTREVGVCALTAGPGVTNGISAIASAQANHSPLLVLGGRAPALRWGQGSLQEIDHVPFVRPLCKLATTAQSTAEIPGLVDEALAAAIAPHGGPTFLDFPLDHVFMSAPEPASAPRAGGVDGAGGADGAGGPEGAGWVDGTRRPRPQTADERELERAAALLAEAERPVIMAGTDLYWDRAEQALLELAESLRIPLFLNGLARGCVPADHDLFFSRTRSQALKESDVALVIGVPMDFRLGFGAAFGESTQIVVVDAAEPVRAHPREPAAELYGGIAATLSSLRVASGARPLGGPTFDSPPGNARLREGAGGEALDSAPGIARLREGAGGKALDSAPWIARLREAESERREAERAECEDERAPLHPMRLYAELARVLDRDAIVIGDGGDFVSYAGRTIESFQPGCWLDPGPFGCLGAGPGYALAAKLAHPDRQVVLLLGDGAFGFAGLEFDTFARHGVNVVGLMGNNGIWALEKHPMEFLYGYSVAADLRPATRYDRVVAALGCHGELVQRPGDVAPALERAFAAGVPALVNVLTDPAVAYPRKANLA